MIDFPLLEEREAVSLLDAPSEEGLFVRFVLDFYAAYGRSFPWRETEDPYRILLSEVMLQQTQTGRVLDKYAEFLGLWPDFRSLAEAPFPDVLSHWLGLGYNRRAKALRQAAEKTSGWGWTIPDDPVLIRELPGVGPATCAALRCFCYHEKDIYLETNIRRVLIHVFHPGETAVSDEHLRSELASLLSVCGDTKVWYYALMDYGVFLKHLLPNPNHRSASYHLQGTFKGSNRQVRGQVLRVLDEAGGRNRLWLEEHLPFDGDMVDQALTGLVSEGLVEEHDGNYRIAR